MSKKERITKLLAALNEGLVEREDTMAVSLLCALAQQNVFLYGPPGTAKSLIARRLSKVFDTKNYFEYLMQRFSTPEEVFGPVSISKLKQDKYERLTEGYLPDADVAFLDEIWKASPAILNTLLTIINEKKFKNGSEIKDVPLKFLVVASNEIPSRDQGLDALYDRFLVRAFVKPVEKRDNFESILQNGTVSEDIQVDRDLIIKEDEYREWGREIEKVQLGEETLSIIQAIRVAIDEYNRKDAKGQKESALYVSDRRWQKAAFLIKASAYFCDRKVTNAGDCLILSKCLWTSDQNYLIVKEQMVEKAIKQNSVTASTATPKLKQRADILEEKIKEELYYTEDIYNTKKIKGKEYFAIKIKDINRIVYIAKVRLLINDTDWWHPVDENGNEYDSIEVKIKNKVCKIRQCHSINYYTHHALDDGEDYTPEVKYNKGDKKEDKNGYVTKGLVNECNDLIRDYDNLLESVICKNGKIKDEVDNPFFSEKEIAIAMEGANNLLDEIKTARKNCDRLKKMITE